MGPATQLPDVFHTHPKKYFMCTSIRKLGLPSRRTLLCLRLRDLSPSHCNGWLINQNHRAQTEQRGNLLFAFVSSGITPIQKRLPTNGGVYRSISFENCSDSTTLSTDIGGRAVVFSQVSYVGKRSFLGHINCHFQKTTAPIDGA